MGRWLILVLLFMLVALQYRLWFGEGSLAQQAQLERQITAQRLENERLAGRNQALALEVAELKSGGPAVEERARYDLGLVKSGETLYLLVPPSDQ